MTKIPLLLILVFSLSPAFAQNINTPDNQTFSFNTYQEIAQLKQQQSQLKQHIKSLSSSPNSTWLNILNFIMIMGLIAWLNKVKIQQFLQNIQNKKWLNQLIKKIVATKEKMLEKKIKITNSSKVTKPKSK